MNKKQQKVASKDENAANKVNINLQVFSFFFNTQPPQSPDTVIIRIPFIKKILGILKPVGHDPLFSVFAFSHRRKA